MKAYVCTQFGPPEVLVLREVKKPEPKDNEILIKVEATTVSGADCNLRGMTYIPTGMGLVARMMLGFKKPKIPIQGAVVAGTVVEAGTEIKRFTAGDRVFGSGPQLGGYAEYACLQETGAITFIPSNITSAEAAVLPYGALTALYFLREMAGIKAGQKVLVNGASGGVGVYAVQLANYFGAEVTGVCSSGNVEFVRSLGAHDVIDYTREDFRKTGRKWDIIFDMVVGKTSFTRSRGSLTENGVYLAVAGGLNDMLQMLWTSIKGGKKVKFGGGTSCEVTANLEFIARLVEENKIKPVLDKTFSFEEMVEAHRYAESGQKKGNIAIAL
jgi:NADPH:quinone reductase-like Zn-dependent oxidoreductase